MYTFASYPLDAPSTTDNWYTGFPSDDPDHLAYWPSLFLSRIILRRVWRSEEGPGGGGGVVIPKLYTYRTYAYYNKSLILFKVLEYT